ncbi:MAG TPA: hypothetical protein VM782_06995, partial [Stellaceae bacterium]|nr:hypothetical protein [Stellaceae bacterium]
MSSPGTSADPRSSPGSDVAVLMDGDVDDRGQPIAELPPLIEPVAAPVRSARRPPRRRFLAPVEANTGVAPPAQVEQLDIPEFVEPVAEASAAVEPPAETPAPAFEVAEPAAATLPAAETILAPGEVAAVLEADAPAPAIDVPEPRSATLRARAARWLASTRARLPATRRGRIILGSVAAVIALGVVAAAIYAAGTGPFSRARPYPVSAAPHDPAQRLAYFQAGAQAGDAESQLQLGILYAKGDGAAQDYATAASWFRAAANQGLARAQYDMGVLYERGRGVAVDLPEAAKWYLKAAQAGYPLGEYNLAVCYTKGQGLQQNLPEAALWYRRAAAHGVVQAMITLAMMYDKGEGVAASPVEAYAWYLAAGKRDN